MLSIALILSGLLMITTPVMALNIVAIEETEHQRVLKSPAMLVEFPLTQEDKDLIKAMKAKLHKLGGVGLAAPQVNKPKRIIAIYIPEDASLLRDNVSPYPMHILINPIYEPISPEEVLYDFESCYSVASKAGKIPRFKQIKLSYEDESGVKYQQIENGFYARVLQHEIDHLNGTLITDRLTPDCLQGSIEEIMAIRRAELSEDKKIVFDQLITKKFKR